MITDALKYFQETEQIVRACFSNVDDFIFPLHRDPLPIFVSSHSDEESFQAEYSAWHKSNEDWLTKWHQNQKAYFEATTSRSFACGFILQVAYNAIYDFSSNTVVHSDFSDIIKPKQKPVKYCMGREIRGIPLGLLIYAGRNQFCHATDGKLNPIGQRVFEFLAIRSDSGFASGGIDKCFDLTNTHLHTFAHNIVALLPWHSYDDYIKDMQALSWA
ncbi:hypothetical protein GETHLI_35720 [Geothrix limicola]|uniref:Uncharacterized protein n=1 Tax=Geothrix limicola TaxID=2927978 RepID=A0ABQ5QJL0_9BACT|nr:hypothetical protein [Geothrix limicola]GLH75069.1 hypothetical protein GETHLI_35720 [Geothrix limicola]